MANNEDFRGLRWEDRGAFGLEPRWTVEPDVEAIKRTIEEIKPSRETEVSFLAQGAFNKLYSVQSGTESLIMRVSLPVDPKNKTLSEVATLDWIRRNTTLPVPEVVSFQAERENSAVDFEWILMTKLPGKPLESMWRSMEYDAKEQLVQQIAVYYASVFQKQFRSIGNLFPGSDDGEKIRQEIYRGPFESSREWLAARLSMHEHETKSILGKLEGQKELSKREKCTRDDAETAQELIERLRTQLDHVFPPTTDGPEPSVLLHDDLSETNILVDEDGNLTGVVDWENVSALPVWKACSYPEFLESPTRNDPLDLSRYDLDDEDTLYWEHLADYEKMRLRQYFMDEMHRLDPRWIEVFAAGRVKRDFDQAVRLYDDCFSAWIIKSWLHELETVEDHMTVRSLKEIEEAYWREIVDKQQ